MLSLSLYVYTYVHYIYFDYMYTDYISKDVCTYMNVAEVVLHFSSVKRPSDWAS